MNATTTTRFTQPLGKFSRFFEGNDAVHQMTHQVAACFDTAGIAYGIVGRKAANAHKPVRTTADVVELIRQNNLDDAYQNRLQRHVRSDFIECLEEQLREDEYERRQDEAFNKTERGENE